MSLIKNLSQNLYNNSIFDGTVYYNITETFSVGDINVANMKLWLDRVNDTEIRVEYKLKVYTDYLLPSVRFSLTYIILQRLA